MVSGQVITTNQYEMGSDSKVQAFTKKKTN
jgi:hypothetical protein